MLEKLVKYIFVVALLTISFFTVANCVYIRYITKEKPLAIKDRNKIHRDVASIQNIDINGISDKSFVEQEETLVNIGNSYITSIDLDFVTGYDQCYGNLKKAKEYALIKLINNVLEHEVLVSAFNILISYEDLKMQSDWSDKNTRAPAILNCVKQTFGFDTLSYLKIYIEPIISNKLLHIYFSQSKEINKNEIALIDSIMKELKTGKKLEIFQEYKKEQLKKDQITPDAIKQYNITLPA
ncbi:MAG: hypothetical protein HGB12_16645, partial [Bacteroidetes bacterium]|nr:hypothetical protein [Bacteroidota bacterium]